MSLTLLTNSGCTEAVIDENGNYDQFFRLADFLSDALKVRFTLKLDDFEALYWNFVYKGHKLTLHYNIYNGVSIFPENCGKAVTKDNDAVVELAMILAQKIDAQA